MSQTLTLPRRRTIRPAVVATPAAERVLRDVAFVLRLTQRVSADIRTARPAGKLVAA